MGVGRRAMLCGLVVGLGVAILAGWRGWPGWLGPLITVLIAVTVAARAWRGAPDTDATARFLDRELELKEQLATALELGAQDPRGSSALAARVREGAGLSARDATGNWMPRGVPAPKEWAIVALLCGLIALAAVPHGGGQQAARITVPSPTVASPVETVPTVPVPPAGGQALAVQVTVVSSSQAGGTPTMVGTPVQHLQPRSTPVRGLMPPRAATPQAGAARRGAGAGAGTGATGTSTGGVATATSGQRTVPLINPSESFLPTTPTAPGKSGTFTSGTQAKPGTTRGGSQSGAAGAASRGASGAAKGGAATKGSGQGGQNAGSKGGAAAAKPGAATGQTTQCLYGCRRIDPSQLAAPGLITGKGQFTGKGTPGGKTAGHGLGAAPGTGSVATPRTPTASKGLAISSAYGPTAAAGRSARQVAGHNGAGGAQRSPPPPVRTGARPSTTWPPTPTWSCRAIAALWAATSALIVPSRA